MTTSAFVYIMQHKIIKSPTPVDTEHDMFIITNAYVMHNYMVSYTFWVASKSREMPVENGEV